MTEPGMGTSPHLPVLYQEIITALDPKSPGKYLDGTVGAGGHAWGILQASSPDGRLFGMDVDPLALSLAAERLAVFGERAVLRQASYVTMRAQLDDLGWEAVQGIVLDLGASSMQFDNPERGFSFQAEGPLDMRFSPDAETTAADLVNRLSERELADLIWRYGEEPHARRIARAIISARPLETTSQLAQAISRASGRTHNRIHPATRTFQALRITVNHELESLESVLPETVGLLAPRGRVAIIAFHSLEDRIVKQFFIRESRDCICPPEQPVCTCGHHATLKLLTRHPVQASENEVKQNPRARSAKLRVAERL